MSALPDKEPLVLQAVLCSLRKRYSFQWIKVVVQEKNSAYMGGKKTDTFFIIIKVFLNMEKTWMRYAKKLEKTRIWK